MQDNIRVLVVDDSALMRTLISEMIAREPGIEVVGTARTGLEAISAAGRLSPDVMTLDVEMPELGGVEALRHIMRKSPTKVIMLSGVNSADVTYEALASGAVDFIAKPSGTFSPDIASVGAELIAKIRVAADVDVSHLAESHPKGKAPAERRTHLGRARPSRVVAIAASTGGPAAVERVIAGLPADLPAACLVVQHLPVGFSSSFAKRLDRFSSLEVRHADAGDKITPGVVYVAPAGHHMTVADRPTMGPVIRLDTGPSISGLRPAADRTMQSAAEVYREDVVGVVLTGMGNDGAVGMAQIKGNGGFTIAQDKDTCVVYGMPRAAAERGVVDKVVPLQHVATEIRKAVAKEVRARDGR